jgi:Flagellar C1a complex subunit C1a-32
MSFLTFTHVPEATAEKLIRSKTPQEALQLIKSSTSLLTVDLDTKRSGIELEFHLKNVRFCLEEKLTVPQVSALLSIFKETLRQGLAGRMPLEALRELFNSLILSHSVDRSPFSEPIFTYEELVVIFRFAEQSLFLCYPIYKQVFLTELVLKVQSKKAVGVSDAPIVDEEELDTLTQLNVNGDSPTRRMSVRSSTLASNQDTGAWEEEMVQELILKYTDIIKRKLNHEDINSQADIEN